VIRTLAALALLTASTHVIAASAAKSDPKLSSTAPWWEKVTVTIAGDGKPQACRYETSLQPNASEQCDVTGDQAGVAKSSGTKSELTRITFERRFTPGSAPIDAQLPTGDTLLGRQVMALAIDSAGSVKGCRVVSAAGDMTPDYGCKEAAAEKFEASAGQVKTGAGREGMMTVLVYGHSEHVV
jgi:hypothetical protein